MVIRRLVRFTLYSVMGVLCCFSLSSAGEIPVGDAFDAHQGEDFPPNYHPRNPAHPPVHRSMNPNLTNNINEPHPFPEYLRKFIWDGNIPHYYHELLLQEPVDQVQTKVFNPDSFRMARRIGVVSFENKTQGRFKEEAVGNLIANKLSRGLERAANYKIIHPTQMVDEYRFEIIAQPSQKPSGEADSSEGDGAGNKARRKIVYDLPYSSEKIDAVMIGAVTKYDNTYVDRAGSTQGSNSTGVEFGAFLISTRTGDVLWGARFIGSQTPSLGNLFNGKHRWLNREELTQYAIERVLKAFYENQGQKSLN